VLRRGRVARSSYWRKASRIGEAHAFHEASAEPVSAASEPQRGQSPKATHANEHGGGDRDARGKRSVARGGVIRRPCGPSYGCRSGSRAVKRGSPQPQHVPGGPELPGTFPARLRTGGEARERKTIRVCEHEPQGSERERASRGRRKASRGSRNAALGNDEVQVLELEGFGVQKSIGRIAGRDARGRYQAHHGHARPSSKETHAAQ